MNHDLFRVDGLYARPHRGDLNEMGAACMVPARHATHVDETLAQPICMTAAEPDRAAWSKKRTNES